MGTLDLVEQALNLQGTAKENFRKDFVKFVRKWEQKGIKIKVFRKDFVKFVRKWEQKGIKIKVTSYRPLTEALKKVLIFSSEFLKSIFGKKEKEIIKKMTKEGGYPNRICGEIKLNKIIARQKAELFKFDLFKDLI